MKILLGLCGLALVCATGLVLYARSEFTTCHGRFSSERAAEAARTSSQDAGYDAELDSRTAVSFSSGETGDDAREFREYFRYTVALHGGAVARPDGGCIERTNFD